MCDQSTALNRNYIYLYLFIIIILLALKYVLNEWFPYKNNLIISVNEFLQIFLFYFS